MKIAKKWEIRRDESQFIRKRNVAAYFRICKELGISVKYAHSDMIISICDKCIRDYLSQLDNIFIESGMKLETFIKTKGLKTTVQDRGIRSASENKKQLTPSSEVSTPKEIERLFNALGIITRELQNNPDDLNSLQSPERGKFEILLANISNNYKDLLDFIDEADHAGFLKITEKDTVKIGFRVHSSLAPAYGFSYRKPQYNVFISPREMWLIANEENEQEYINLINKIITNVEKNKDLPLFGE